MWYLFVVTWTSSHCIKQIARKRHNSIAVLSLENLPSMNNVLSSIAYVLDESNSPVLKIVFSRRFWGVMKYRNDFSTYREKHWEILIIEKACLKRVSSKFPAELSIDSFKTKYLSHTEMSFVKRKIYPALVRYRFCSLRVYTYIHCIRLCAQVWQQPKSKQKTRKWLTTCTDYWKSTRDWEISFET